MTIVFETDERLRFVKVSDAIVPPAGLIEHFKNRYWLVHPEKGLLFWQTSRKSNWTTGSPQCNTNKDVSEMIQKEMYPWAKIEFIPSVFRRIRPQDYV